MPARCEVTVTICVNQQVDDIPRYEEIENIAKTGNFDKIGEPKTIGNHS